jgi:hypothetical protein
MIRVVTAMATVWLALAQPITAVAHAASGAVGVSDAAAPEPEQHEPREQTSATQSAPNTAAICSEGASIQLSLEALTPGRSVETSIALVPLKAPAQDDAPLAWCMSSDDPRCAPLDTGAPYSAQRAATSACAGGAVEVQAFDLHRNSVAAKFGSVELYSPRAGVHLSIERPPRA